MSLPGTWIGAKRSLWTLVTPPTVWALHFLIAYPTAALACAREDAGGFGLDAARLTIAAITAVALGIIAVAGYSAWRGSGGTLIADDPLDDATLDSRSRFLANATLLLAGLSFIATLYVAMPALVFATCR